MDTDYVNISSLLKYAKYLSQTTTIRPRIGGASGLTRDLPPSPALDELPPNHVMITSGARDINGGWVPLSTAKSVAKNYHDLPTFVRRIFLSETLAEKFPEPVLAAKRLLVAVTEREKRANAYPPFGKAFEKPESLSASDLHTGPGSPQTPMAMAIPMPTPTPTSTRHAPSHSSTLSSAGPSALSPDAVLSTANEMACKEQYNPQSLLSLLAQSRTWATGLVKTPTEPEPLAPEEEEMFKTLLKSPPRSKSEGAIGRETIDLGTGDEEKERMNVDDKEEEAEEEEAVREVVDIGSEQEGEEEEAEGEDMRDLTMTLRSRTRTLEKKTEVNLPPRRSLRGRPRSLSSSSSELTVSESESSASPPSLDSRPVLKGKSTNIPRVSMPVKNVRGRRNTGSEPIVKIIKVDEPKLPKPRRSERMAKGDKPEPASSAIPVVPRGKTFAPAASSLKPKRTDKEKEKEQASSSVTTRAGALKTQKRALRSRA